MKGKIWFFIGVVIFVLVVAKSLHYDYGMSKEKTKLREQGYLIDINQFYGKSVEDIRGILDSHEYFNEYVEIEPEVNSGDTAYEFKINNLPEVIKKEYGFERLRLKFYKRGLDNGEVIRDMVVYFDGVWFESVQLYDKTSKYLFDMFNIDSMPYTTYTTYAYLVKKYRSNTENIDYIYPKYEGEYRKHLDKVMFKFNYDSKSEKTEESPNLKEYHRTEEEKKAIPVLEMMNISKWIKMNRYEMFQEALDVQGWEHVESDQFSDEYLIRDIPKIFTDKYGFDAIRLSKTTAEGGVDYIDENVMIDFHKLDDSKNESISYETRVILDIDCIEEVYDMLNLEYTVNDAFIKKSVGKKYRINDDLFSVTVNTMFGDARNVRIHLND